MYKDTLTSPVSAVLTADYRMSGAAELLVVGASGEVRGYIPTVVTSADNGESLGNRKQQVCVCVCVVVRIGVGFTTVVYTMCWVKKGHNAHGAGVKSWCAAAIYSCSFLGCRKHLVKSGFVVEVGAHTIFQCFVAGKPRKFNSDGGSYQHLIYLEVRATVFTPFAVVEPPTR